MRSFFFVPEITFNGSNFRYSHWFFSVIKEQDVECVQTELLKVYVKSKSVPLSLCKKKKEKSHWFCGRIKGKISLYGLLDVREYYSILL